MTDLFLFLSDLYILIDSLRLGTISDFLRDTVFYGDREACLFLVGSDFRRLSPIWPDFIETGLNGFFEKGFPPFLPCSIDS